MQQSTCRLCSHACEPIRGACDNALEEPEYAAQILHFVKRGHDVDFRSARVSEAGVDRSGEQ
jgi:hypothetical protein